MCRGLNDDCATAGRRCPSSSPARRSAYRKAHSAARSASATAEPIAPGSDTDPGFDPHDLSRLEARVALARQLSAATGRSTTDPAHNALGTVVSGAVSDRYGSYEAAARALGAAMATRAEELAGVTGEQVRAGLLERFGPARARLDELNAQLPELRRELEEKHGGLAGYLTDELQAERRELWDADDRRTPAWEERWAAHQSRVDAAREAFETTGPGAAYRTAEDERDSLNWARSSLDDTAREQLATLSRGYRDAIAEMRETGGETSWHDKTPKKARALFDAPVEYFPADWVAASTARGPMVAKLQRSRAHYSDGHHERTRRKVQSRDNWTVDTPDREASLRERFADTPYYDVAEQVEETSYGSRVLPVYEFEVAPRYTHPGDGPAPRGRGWERWVSEDGEQSAWRRPRNRMETVSTEKVAEIKSYVVGSDFDPSDPTTNAYATAVHEWQHRFEYSVPGITLMERQFLERRAGDEDLEPIYKGRKEMGYRDDFVEHYMGKVYTGNAYEVMSMGAESLFSGHNGGLVGAHSGGKMHADDDMRAFVLGVYGSAGRTDVDPDEVVETLTPEQQERYFRTRDLLQSYRDEDEARLREAQERRAATPVDA